MENPTNIIVLEKLIETRLRKEKEIRYYQEQLEELGEKLKHLQMDIDVTNIIINMIEGEKVVDIKSYLLEGSSL
jgi:phage regulator Rha-like protein